MRQKMFITGLTVLLCTVIYLALPTPKAMAASCSGPDIAFGRQANCGWYNNVYVGSGNALFSNGMGSVETPSELVSYLQGKCNDGGTDRAAAGVIIMDMLGYDAPQQGGCSSFFSTWSTYVNYYGSYGCSNDICSGPSGSIHFNEQQTYFCGEVDTYMTLDSKGNYDVAPYLLTGSTDPACGTSADEAIVFYNTNNNQIFLIRRACGNILRSIGSLSPPPFNLTPSVTKSVSTGQTIAVPYDTITFTFAVRNTGDGPSDKTTCTEYANEFSGNHGTPGGPNYDKGGAVSTLCSNKIFGTLSNTTLKTETVTVGLADVNHTICRTLYVAPASYTTASRGAEACVYVSTYDLVPTINDTSTGPSNAFVEAGDKLTFVYAVDNTQPGPSHKATCTEYANEPANYYAAPAPPAYDTWGTQSTLCSAKVFTGNQNVTLKTEVINVTAAMDNTTICRTLTVSPSSPTVATLGTEVCVPVVNMPYARVFDGDVSAGNAQGASTCSPTDDYNAGIVGWNIGSNPYNGAGAQYAAFAIGNITGFASSQSGNAGSKGKPPSGLAFANTAVGGSVYGGDLGASSLPCMSDYYQVPAGAIPITTTSINLSTMSSGAYSYSLPSELTVSGTLATGATPKRIQIFVNSQNVYISSPGITYQNGWASISQIPMFELVVQSGNIYIDHNVPEVDGTYIAQNSQQSGKGVGGLISTCATAAGPEALGANLYSNCNGALTVDGSFIADDVMLERSANTLSSSSTDNPANLTSSAAEQFNYNPSLWLAQPPTTPGALTYNTIVDLPPIL